MTDQPSAAEQSTLEAERLGRLVVPAAELLAPSVRGLFVLDAQGDPVAVGSCVLLWHRGVRYLLTAAHVVERHPADMLFIGAESRLVPLPPPFFLRQLEPEQLREDDVFDYAFRPVTEAEAAELDGCRFLSASQVAEKDAPAFEAARSAYLALGYPRGRFATRAGSTDGSDEQHPRAGFIDSRDNHTELGLNPQAHVLMRFPYADTAAPEGEAPAHTGTGMSGGGVFRFPAFEDRGAIAPPALAAIVIEARLAEEAIIGVRIGVVLAAIDKSRA